MNPSCFGLPDLLHNGPYQLPFLAEPAFFNSDLSAQKSFKVVREQTIQFRISAFNFLNHPLNTISNSFNNQYQLNFTNPNSSTFAQNGSNGSLGFGTDPYKTGRRIVELMLKYNFQLQIPGVTRNLGPTVRFSRRTRKTFRSMNFSGFYCEVWNEDLLE